MYKSTSIVLGVVVLVILLLVVGPLLTIWAANTLFPALAIPYSMETWFAVVVLGAFFRANVTVRKN
jgi:urea transporter